MRQVNVHGPGDVRLDPAPRPVPGRRDALVRICACGICGTDLAYIRGGGRRDDGSRPMPLGHEASGIVLEVGPEAQGLRPGQRVVVNPMGTDDVIGNGGSEGAFTEALLIRDAAMGRSLFEIPDHLSLEAAALTEPLGVAMHAVNRGQLTRDSKVVVFGAGPIGLGAVLWMRKRGLRDIVSVDITPERLELARKMGAEHTVHAGVDDLEATLAKVHGTQGAFRRRAVSTDVYIDAAGAPSILGDVLRLTRAHARLVVVAVHHQPVPLDFSQMLSTEMTITTSMGYPTELPDVIAGLATMTPEEIEPLISRRFDFDHVLDAFEAAGQQSAAKVLVSVDP
jgi:threonine dehydrogenase-like Zn-dependent dehydrogenase